LDMPAPPAAFELIWALEAYGYRIVRTPQNESWPKRPNFKNDFTSPNHHD
jgi:hypothetical protein